MAVFFVEVDNGFSVAVGAVDMAARLKLRPQFGVVVDFAVEDDPQGAVFVAERLMAGGEVDNAETAHAESNRTCGVDAVVVRTAVGHDVAHAAHDPSFNPGTI